MKLLLIPAAMITLNLSASSPAKSAQSAAQKKDAALASSGVMKAKPKTAAQGAQYQATKQKYEQQTANHTAESEKDAATSLAVTLRDMLKQDDQEAEQPTLIFDN